MRYEEKRQGELREKEGGGHMIAGDINNEVKMR